MDGSRRMWSTALGLVVLAWNSVGWAASGTSGVAGGVLAVDQSAGRIVVGDMGPRRDDGTSEIVRRSILVTPATEFVEVKRACGVAPSGWTGDFEEHRLSTWDVKPGDFVSVTVRPSSRGAEALKLIVVDTKGP